MVLYIKLNGSLFSRSTDMLLDDSGDGSSRKEGGRHVKIVVCFQDEVKWKEVSWVWCLFSDLPSALQ